jgi:hypothetical protein
LVGLTLGLVAYGLAQEDLKKMAEGGMDPNGLDEAELAKQRARDGMLWGLFFGAFSCCAWWALLRYGYW